MSIKNESSFDINIIKVTSKVAQYVELHTHDMQNGVMKMYQVPSITIPKKGKVVLQPSGFHIMLIGLYQTLSKEENVPFTLEFSNGEVKTIIAPVKSVMNGMKHHMNHQHK